MASIETNMKFVKELFSLDKITIVQKNEILDLLAKEISVLTNIRLNEQENKIDTKSNVVEHNPIKVIETLKKFTYDQKLKWTVHLWDGGIKYKSYREFMEDLDQNIASLKPLKKEFVDLKSYNLKIYQILFSFVFQDAPVVTKEGTVIPYKWGRDKIKIGWRFPSGLLEDWADKKGNWTEHKKSPFTMPLVGADVQIIKTIFNGVEEEIELKTFNAVVNQFKKEIEFRGSAFYRMIKRKLEILSGVFPHDKLPNDIDLQNIFYKNHEFFASTWQFELALDRIFHGLANRPTAAEYPIEFFSENINEGELNYKKVEILHKGSFSGATYKGNLKLQGKGGDMQELIKTLTSVCHFSIESKFYSPEDSSLKSYRIDYLYDDIGQINDQYISKEPILLSEPALGFKYIFKFPI